MRTPPHSHATNQEQNINIFLKIACGDCKLGTEQFSGRLCSARMHARHQSDTSRQSTWSDTYEQMKLKLSLTYVALNKKCDVKDIQDAAKNLIKVYVGIVCGLILSSLLWAEIIFEEREKRNWCNVYMPAFLLGPRTSKKIRSHIPWCMY